MSPGQRDPPARVSLTVVLAAISLAAALLLPALPRGAAEPPGPACRDAAGAARG